MAAAPPNSKANGKDSNFVAQDRIWKNLIQMESETAKRWPESWGFLKTSYNELCDKETVNMKEAARLATPEHLKVRPVTPLDVYIKAVKNFSPHPFRAVHGTVNQHSHWPTEPSAHREPPCSPYSQYMPEDGDI